MLFTLPRGMNCLFPVSISLLVVASASPLPPLPPLVAHSTPPSFLDVASSGGIAVSDIHVAAFGADSTGVEDSSAAFSAALAAAFAAGAVPRARVPYAPSGVSLLLDGGTYSLSAPLLLHGLNATGLSIRGGTLVARTGFPSASFLIDVKSTSALTFTDLVLDAAHLAGCLRIESTTQVHVARAYFLHYATTGLLGAKTPQLPGGHELLGTSLFFAEYAFGEPGYNDSRVKTGTAWELQYPDSALYNSVVRCSLRGIVNAGAANLYHGVHVYTTCSPHPSATPTLGFVLTGGKARVTDCYCDDSTMSVSGEALAGLALHNTHFLGTAELVLTPSAGANTPLQGLLVHGSQFDCGPDACARVVVNTSDPTSYFDTTTLVGVSFADNAFQNASTARTTRPTVGVSVAAPAGASEACAEVDLSQRLLLVSAASMGEGVWGGLFSTYTTGTPTLNITGAAYLSLKPARSWGSVTACVVLFPGSSGGPWTATASFAVDQAAPSVAS